MAISYFIDRIMPRKLLKGETIQQRKPFAEIQYVQLLPLIKNGIYFVFIISHTKTE